MNPQPKELGVGLGIAWLISPHTASLHAPFTCPATWVGKNTPQALRLQLHRVLLLALQQTERLLALSEEEEEGGMVDAKHGEFDREVRG